MDSQAAYLQVYQAEYERLRSYLRRRTSADTADDITQETWTRLWQHWDEVGAARAPAWAWTIARRLLIDSYRREARQAGGWTWWPQPDDGWQERAERRSDLARWWKYLTGEQQQALLLHFGEDMSYPQIAAALGVDEAALRRRAQRGWEGLERRIRGRKRWAREG